MPLFWLGQGEYEEIINRLTNLRANQLVIMGKLNLLLKQENEMAVDLSALTAEVQKNTDVSESVVQVVANLVAALAAIPPSTDSVTQAAIDDLKAKLSANDEKIAAAVVAGTPAAP